MTFWKYRQSTGELFGPTDMYVATGYSGRDNGKNNPDMQDKQCVGPIPRGFYEIGEPFDSTTHGPYCLRLTPFPENAMWGREGFLIHGDSKVAPGHASEGCIIQGPAIRKLIQASGVKVLEVVL